MRTLVLLVALSGCAIAHITRPDGTVIDGAAFGQAKVECCDQSPGVLQSQPCTTVTGGVLSAMGEAALAAGFAALVAIFA